MSITYTWSAPVNTASDVDVVVRQALLPILLWPSVPVVQSEEERLTVIERYVIEAAVRVGSVTAAEVNEVTGIPLDVVTRIAGRLVALELLDQDAAEYTPTAAAAQAVAADQRSVPVHRIGRLTFLYLPQGDDLIAYVEEPGHTAPPLLDPDKAPGYFPLPRRLAGRDRTGFLRERIAAGRVSGLPDAVVDVHDVHGGPEGAGDIDSTELTLPLGCPVYHCEGTVSAADAEPELRLRLTGRQQKKTSFRIDGAGGQAAYWAERAGLVQQAVACWTDSGGTVQVQRRAPTRWSVTVDGLAATAAQAEGTDLSRPAGLSVQSPGCITYVHVTFQPADRAARQVFALQDAVLRVTSEVSNELTDDTVLHAIATARATYGLSDVDLTESAVREQLWRDGHFQHVYALRKDFADYA